MMSSVPVALSERFFDRHRAAATRLRKLVGPDGTSLYTVFADAIQAALADRGTVPPWLHSYTLPTVRRAGREAVLLWNQLAPHAHLPRL